MRSYRKATFALLIGVLAVTLAGSAIAPAAGASPVWKFEGSELKATETIAGNASEGRLFFPGLTIKCQETLYEASISNNVGTGQAKINKMTFNNCSTDSKACTVELNVAEKLPWPAQLTTVGTSNYIVIEGIKVLILLGGKECALGGTKIAVTGSAGGLYTNLSETITFSSSTFPATGTELKALGSTVEWKGVFSTEATGPHHGEKLTIS